MMSSKKDRSAIVSGAGLLTSIFTNLVAEVKKRGGDDEDIHRLTTPEGADLLERIADLIVEDGRTSASRQTSNVWKTIKLGTGLKNADEFRQALKDEEFCINECASDILGNPAFVVAAEETEIDLVVVSVKELGFKDGATRDQIYDRAKELGLELCPAEVGPQLRLQYRDQPTGEWLLIGMEPIAGSDGGLFVFRVRYGDCGLWLCGRYIWPVSFYHYGSQWVFARPRK